MMTLEEYLLTCMMREKSTLEELLKIDNQIMKTNITYEDLVKKEMKKNDFPYSLEDSYSIITDGEMDSVYTILITCAPFIKKINVQKKFIGIYKWLVERTKDYYQEKGILLQIELDIKDTYEDYLKEDAKIILYGFKEFVENLKDIFENKDVLAIEK